MAVGAEPRDRTGAFPIYKASVSSFLAYPSVLHSPNLPPFRAAGTPWLQRKTLEGRP